MNHKLPHDAAIFGSVLLIGIIIFMTVRALAPPASPAVPANSKCHIENVTFPASAEECARIHAAIERRIYHESK